MTDSDRIAALRNQLRSIMQQIEEHLMTTADNPQRCPHRARDGACTFAYGCRNLEEGRCSR